MVDMGDQLRGFGIGYAEQPWMKDMFWICAGHTRDGKG